MPLAIASDDGFAAVVSCRIGSDVHARKSKPENWWLEFARRVIGQWLRKTKAFLALNPNIVCRPTQTSKAVISDDDPKALLHALDWPH
jgi:hypothetical protein